MRSRRLCSTDGKHGHVVVKPIPPLERSHVLDNCPELLIEREPPRAGEELRQPISAELFAAWGHRLVQPIREHEKPTVRRQFSFRG
jgi:hypothetical protein